MENETDPRFGVAVKVPRLNWVFRAFYGDFYQPPPLVTATGALYDLAKDQGLMFAPLHGERDEEHQFGVTIPYRGWALDAELSKHGQRIGWITTISENPISSGRSHGMPL